MAVTKQNVKRRADVCVLGGLQLLPQRRINISPSVAALDEKPGSEAVIDDLRACGACVNVTFMCHTKQVPSAHNAHTRRPHSLEGSVAAVTDVCSEKLGQLLKRSR